MVDEQGIPHTDLLLMHMGLVTANSPGFNSNGWAFNLGIQYGTAVINFYPGLEGNPPLGWQVPGLLPVKETHPLVNIFSFTHQPLSNIYFIKNVSAPFFPAPKSPYIVDFNSFITQQCTFHYLPFLSHSSWQCLSPFPSGFLTCSLPSWFFNSVSTMHSEGPRMWSGSLTESGPCSRKGERPPTYSSLDLNLDFFKLAAARAMSSGLLSNWRILNNSSSSEDIPDLNPLTRKVASARSKGSTGCTPCNM